jgi:cAMP-dependent protein kinase regulator
MEKKKTLRINQNESGSDSDKKGKINLKLKNGGSSSDSGEDEEYLDVVNDPYSPVHHQDQVKMAQKARVSVSAEVFGKYHSKAAFTSKVVKKSKEIQDKIHQRLNSAFMFMSLDEKDMLVVIGAMDEKYFSKGETVIEEGAPGDVLYIVENGELSCHKKIDGKDKHLKNYGTGDVFGELALLYNAPRAATIRAESDGQLWVLDRGTFNHIVKDASQKKRQQYEDFLQTVPILQNMDHYERSKLADAVKEKKVAAGEEIIKQGESGDIFYILVEGNAKATLNENPSMSVMNYKDGDYFGELALLRGEPRAANVIAVDICKLICLDRKSFKRLLGPLDNILKRNMNNYINYMK